MTVEYFNSDGTAVTHSESRQFVNSSGVSTEIVDGGGGGGSVPVTIDCTVGNAVAAGLTANVQVSGTTTINATVGDAVAAGPNVTITQAGTITISCTPGNAVAAGATATISSKIVTSVLVNNAESLHTVTAVHYSWFPGGRIGALNGISPVESTGVSDGAGRFVTNIDRAPGVLLVCVRYSDATTDHVYYEAFL